MADMENVVKAIDICLGHGVCNDCPYCLSGKGYTTMNCRDYMLRDALAMLKEQPEIVRCKDCKHKEESVSPSWEAWCNRLHCGCDLDWYCADGERKEVMMDDSTIFQRNCAGTQCGGQDPEGT